MEVSLKSFVITHPLFASARNTTLSAELVWPRPAISSRVGLLPLELRRGKAALTRRPFYERLLLKEKVDGSFGLVVRITKPGKGPALPPALAEIFSTALSAIGSGLGAPLVNSAIRPIVREPLNQLADVFEDDEPLFIAEAGIDLNAEEDWIGERKFELKTTKTLKIPSEPQAGPRTKTVAKKQKSATVRKGAIIAEVVLELGES